MIETIAPAGGITLRADKAYNAVAHVAKLRKLGLTPPMAQNATGRRSAIDDCTTRHPGYVIG